MTTVFDLFEAKSPSPSLSDDPRTAFETLLTHLETLQHPSSYDRLQAAFDAEAEEMYKALPPKQRKKAFSHQVAAVVLGDTYQALLLRYQEEAEVLMAATAEERESVEAQLAELATLITVVSGEESWRKVGSVSSSAYSTQTASHTYAKASADADAAHYLRAGLEAEVRPAALRDRYPGNATFARSTIVDYEVWVRASNLDVAVAKRKPGLSLVEWVRDCWARGTNPRVYNPWLPPGFEERHGIRYY